MQRLETYSRQNARMGLINEESHRIITYNINVLKGHFFVLPRSLSKRIMSLLIVYLGQFCLDFFSENIAT